MRRFFVPVLSIFALASASSVFAGNAQTPMGEPITQAYPSSEYNGPVLLFWTNKLSDSEFAKVKQAIAYDLPDCENRVDQAEAETHVIQHSVNNGSMYSELVAICMNEHLAFHNITYVRAVANNLYGRH